MASQQIVDLIDIRRHPGNEIVLPETLPLERLIEVAQRKLAEEQTFVDLSATINASPLDGALAFVKAMRNKLGFVVQKQTMSGRESIAVEIDAQGTTINVPWGRFEVPAIEGSLGMGFDRDQDGRYVFQATAHIRSKYTAAWDELVAETKRVVLAESIYKGKALDLRLTNPDGHPAHMARIKFMDTTHARRPIFSVDLDDQYEHDVLMLIDEAAAVRRMNGAPLKSGIILAGEFGVGKTMAMLDIARHCEAAGRTCVYVKAEEIALGIDFLRPYLPGALLVEDVDAVTGGWRSQDVNTLLNKLDGIDTKDMDLIFVATTNDLPAINPAMRRPGRIDTTLEIKPPDAEAAVRIARSYAGDDMPDDADFSESGTVLAGLIPAVIQRATLRARVRAYKRTDGASTVICPDDLTRAARSVQAERELGKHVPPTDAIDRLGASMGRGLAEGLTPIKDALVATALVSTNGHA